MKPRPKLTGKEMDESLALFNTLSTTEIDELGAKARIALESQPIAHDDDHAVSALPQLRSRRSQWRAIAVASAALVGLVVVFLPGTIGASAGVLEDGSGSRQIRYGELVRSAGPKSSVLSAVDGSRIEVQSQAELALERADNGGIKVRLDKGVVIVDAAQQILYVQTKDMMATLTRATSMVRVEEEGSRVAAIEGEVRVKQGHIETILKPGENIATFQQAVPAAERVGFEVASIKPAAPAVIVADDVPGAGFIGGLPPGDAAFLPDNGCVPGGRRQANQGRLVITYTTLFQLITYAYPTPGYAGFCTRIAKLGLISGGPAWAKSDVWNIEGTFPAGTFAAPPGFDNPTVQQMLQTLLAERFNLVMRQETREFPVYLLKVGKDGPKFNGVSERYKISQKERESQLGPDGRPRGHGFGIGFRHFDARQVSMADWADFLFGVDKRPVVDRTGLTGRYDFHFDFSHLTQGLGPGPFSQIEDLVKPESVKAMGFELEESRLPFPVWVIERVEKPSAN